MMSPQEPTIETQPNQLRRDFLTSSASGLGLAALTALLSQAVDNANAHERVRIERAHHSAILKE